MGRPELGLQFVAVARGQVCFEILQRDLRKQGVAKICNVALRVERCVRVLVNESL
jgi:hypothetical protein